MKDEDFLQEKFYFKDARQSLYCLKNIPGTGNKPMGNTPGMEQKTINMSADNYEIAVM
ncbi:hypothetical protein RE474_00890 [Methanolobus sediminis]|uniref:Uncharacterized protein n=1 Tax=Methanolobus sediminis TaxID=3072978 RepID=A0AA51UN02_9EURY|nr:hypothetical protein [Methanolobus sediminis]WMW25306.1 hypothetical protein RE474_00890 [Methanolobus sediminis]